MSITMKSILRNAGPMLTAVALATAATVDVFAADNAAPRTPMLKTITTEHVDVLSTRDFAATVKNLSAELGKASTEKLMDRLSSSSTWEAYAEESADFAGRSGLIEVGHLNWGKVLTLSGIPMKARCFIVGNPATARKLLAAGGPAVGLYLPTKIFVFEDADGRVHVSYDKFLPIMAPLGKPALDEVAAAIDGVLERLAKAAVG